MKSSLRWILALALLAGLLSGCGKKANDPVSPTGGTTGSSGMDQAGVSSALASTPQLIEDGLFESPDQGSIGGAPGALAAIRPFTYWRTITHVDRYFRFAFADTDSTGRPTTARVTVRKDLTGSFNILAGPPPEIGAADSVRIPIVRKPLVDHWVRRVLLKRLRGVGDGDRDPHHMWRVVAASGVNVTSEGAATHIVSLRVQSGPLDTLITDPLDFFRLRHMLNFDVADSVRLTVTTGRNDDVVVLMFRGLRSMFHNNGDNSYTRVWRVPPMGGLEHLGVNAFSRGTLFDDALPYDSQAWILPYVVRPALMAEYLP